MVPESFRSFRCDSCSLNLLASGTPGRLCDTLEEEVNGDIIIEKIINPTCQYMEQICSQHDDTWSCRVLDEQCSRCDEEWIRAEVGRSMVKSREGLQVLLKIEVNHTIKGTRTDLLFGNRGLRFLKMGRNNGTKIMTRMKKE